MIPSRRVVRFFLIYGLILFAVDRFFISSSRSAIESFVFVLVADLVAILLYSLLRKWIIKNMSDS